MRLKDIKKGVENWKNVNISFFKEQVKNQISGKKKLHYSPKLLSEIYSKSTPVFFLSTGRCGTKYISNILENSTLLDVYHHAFPELVFHQQFAYESPKAATTKSMIDIARIELIVESYRRNRIFIETNNRLTFYCYALAELFPKSKFVHITRHPGNFVRSGLNRNWYSGATSIDMGRIIPQHLKEKWPGLSQAEKIAALWNETNLFIEDFKKYTDDKSRVFQVKAEDIFTKSNKLEELIYFCGTTNISKKMRRNFMKPVNAQTKVYKSQYDNWTDQEKKSVKKMAPLFNNYNYEL